MPTGLQGQPWLPERRQALDRRLGDRRRCSVPVADDRRRTDRRRVIDRREGPAGHVRNALQVLTAVVYGEVSGPDVNIALNGAIDRLWKSLPEIDRLEDSCRELGNRIRKMDPESEVN
jgi:hypothetical protein